MTFDEMCDILAAEYPEIVEFDLIPLSSDSWSGSSNYGSYTCNGSSIIVKAGRSYNSSNSAGAITVNTVDKFNIDKYNYLKIQGTAVWSASSTGSGYNHTVYLRIKNYNTDVVLKQFDLMTNGSNKSVSIDENFDLSSLGDLSDVDIKISIYVAGYNNNSNTGTTTLTLNSLKFYK